MKQNVQFDVHLLQVMGALAHSQLEFLCLAAHGKLRHLPRNSDLLGGKRSRSPADAQPIEQPAPRDHLNHHIHAD